MLAANVDLALVTEPLPDPKARRLERFAALAAAGGVPSALILTKSDLDDEGYLKAAALARRMGVADSLAVSAVTGEGMNAVRQLLTPGTTAVLLGASGHRQVDARQRAARRGAPGHRRGARVRPARPPHHGHPRAALAARAAPILIDTPGIRVAGLWDGTGESFADVDELATAVPLRRLRATRPSPAARSVRSSTPNASRPGASSSASWRGWRTGAPPPAHASSAGRRSRSSSGTA